MFNLKKGESGFTFIEVLIALLILSVISSVFLLGLATSSRAMVLADERTTAEGLARSQMDDVVHQGYKQPTGGEAIYMLIGNVPDGWSIKSIDAAGDVVDDIVGMTWNTATGQAVTDDDNLGIQRLDLVIFHGDKEVLRLEGFMVDML
jgi:prepilin-type N-terminal cleavage/methylation domain-containing protein